MRTILVTLMLASSFSAIAASQTVFVVKKNMRAKNYIDVSVETDSRCLLQKKVFLHWIMGQENGQREELSPDEKKDFDPVVKYIKPDRTELDFSIAQEDKIKAYIPDPTITVRASKVGTACKTKAYITIDNLEVELKEVMMNIGVKLSGVGLKSAVIIGTLSNGTSFNKTIKP